MHYVNICHHTESYLTASTLNAMIQKVKKNGSNYFAVAENGSLISALKVYYAASAAGLKPIIGIDLYFKDEFCSIINGTPSEQAKYFKLLMFFRDQAAYQTMVSMISDKGRKKVKIGEDHEYPLFNWTDLERLSKLNVLVSSSNIEDMVSKHLLFDRPDLSKRYYERLIELFGDRYTPAICPFEHTHYQERLIEFTLIGNKKIRLPLNTRVDTDSKGFKTKAIDIYKNPKRYKKLLRIYYNGLKSTVKLENQDILGVEMVKDFVQIDRGDIQALANKQFIELHGTNLLINDYAYYADKDDKIVQNMKLGEDGKCLHQDLYIRSAAETALYLKNLGLAPEQIKGVFENTQKWASQFDDFKLKYDIKLVDYGPEPEKLLIKAIKERGRMKWDDPRYVKQLKEELDLLVNNGVVNLSPYFLPLIEISDYYVKNHRLPGPARGSAGGFLISYLAGITQIDPIKYDLSTERFLTKDRVQQGNFPDIDWDSEGRELLVGEDGNSGFLKERFGDKYAQISTRNLLRIKSAILDANRFLHGEVQPEIQKFSKSLPNTPQGITDHDFIFGYESNDEHVAGLFEINEDLKKYAQERPKEWEIVKKAVSLSRQVGRHACFAAGTLVDSDGKVEFIENQPSFAVSKPIKTWYVGEKDTVLVSFNNGISIKCTPDHRFMVGSKEVEAADLLGYEVSYKPFSNVSGTLKLSLDEAFSLGWFWNDGCYIQTAKRFEFYFTPKKDDEAKDRILAYLQSQGCKVTPDKNRADTYKTYSLNWYFQQNINKNYKKRLPEFFWKLDLESQREFLKGLFSANGYCLRTRSIVGIKLTSKLLLSDIAVWLNANNIQTNCAYTKPKAIKHTNGTYISKSTGTLSIPHVTNKKLFRDLIGFQQTYKKNRLDEIIANSTSTKYTQKPIRCVSIEAAGIDKVYDFNEPLENVGYINGILVHNCAYILSSEPISNIVPVVKVGEIDQVTAFEAKECEKAGLIKYDFLVVSAIKDIRMCIDNINRKNGDKFEVGYFNHKGQKTYVWDVPEDADVFNMMGMGETETVFQFNTTSVTPFVKEIRPKSIIELATITALVRPGPLDYIDKDTGRNMAEEYIERKRGRSFSDIKVLDKLIPETHSILVFQEQITKIAKELGGMSIVDAENVRIAMGKKKLKLMDSLKPKFIEGAKKVISEEEANKVWDMMATFGRYGFNKSHSVAYSVIGYTCAFLKYHYPLEWWAAVLTNADTKEINEVFYKYVKDIMLPPDINLSKEEITIDYEKQKLRQKLSAITGLGGKVAEKIIAARPFKDLKDFVIKKPCGPAMTRRLIYIGALDSLMPAEANTMLKKMWLYEETVKQVEWEAKIEELMKQPESEERNVKLQKLKDKGRGKAKIDPYYMVIDPLKDYLIKKEICPTMNLDLYELIKKYAKNLTIFPRNGAHMVIDNRGFEVYLAGPNVLEKMDSAVIDRNAYFCVPGYVIKAETFTYAKNTKKAYKLIIDSSGYISEKVIWPDYDTGELKYPKSLKKGCLAFFFYQKRAEKEGVNIYHSVVEVEGIDEDE